VLDSTERGLEFVIRSASNWDSVRGLPRLATLSFSLVSSDTTLPRWALRIFSFVSWVCCLPANPPKSFHDAMDSNDSQSGSVDGKSLSVSNSDCSSDVRV